MERGRQFWLKITRFGVLFPTFTNTSDTVTIGSSEPLERINETGLGRLRKLFETDEFGNPSKEVISVLHVGMMSTFIGGAYGGFLFSRNAFTEFMRKNQATSFTNHFEAKRKLQEAVMVAFGKGAFKWSWRLALFCTTFTGTATAISVYRNKNGILEYVAAGLFTGSLYKFNMGPRGWIVGGGLGGVLGLFAGCATVGLLKIAGLSIDEARSLQYQFDKSRSEMINKGIRKHMEEREEQIYSVHEEKIGPDGLRIENIEK